MRITEVFTPASIAYKWNEAQSNRIPYLGEGLFPAMQKAGLDLRWIKGSHGLPVSLMPTAFDAQATFRDRPGLEITETEMPFFREGFKIKERDRQELLRISEINDPYLQQAVANLYNDSAELIEGALVVSERERMQLLFPLNGNMGISIKANGVDYTYNYDPNGDWKTSNFFELTGQAVWTDKTHADPFRDIRTAKKAINAKTGSTPVYAVMNSETFDLIGQIDSVKNRWLTVNGLTLGYLTDDQIIDILKNTVSITPVIYDKQFKDESGVVSKFVPDGYVALIPDGALGQTVYGVTPEQADLYGNEAAKSKVAIVNTGIAITQTVDEHPVNLNTFASEIVLPSYERMDEVALLKVK